MSVTYGQKLHAISADRENKSPFWPAPWAVSPARRGRLAHAPRSRVEYGAASAAWFWRTLSHGCTCTW
jgi:hypothetical protein